MESHGRLLVSVVIPTIDAGASLRPLLEAISTQQIAADIEVVVVDSSSRDNTPVIARNAGAEVITIRRSEFGHGRTRNMAIRASRGSFVALTVQDAVPTDRRWLDRLISPLMDSHRVAGSYGLQVAPPWAGLLAKARSWGWCQRHSSPVVNELGCASDFWTLTPEERLELIRFDNVTGCLRRSVWEDVPFPEREYGEDMAWAKQVLLSGYQTAFVPESRVWHSHERGWIYDLRRAYTDGFERVGLVDWPNQDLSLREALRALRRAVFFALTDRFDTMVQPTAIRRFVKREIELYECREHDRAASIYVKALQFSLVLLNNALRCCDGDELSRGTWSELLRFAVLALVGENLGANVGGRLREGNRTDSLGWLTVHRLLYGGV